MRGLAYEWILGMVGLFVVGFFFIMLDQAYDPLFDHANANIPINVSDTVSTIQRNNFTIIDSIWTYFLVIVVFLFVLYMLNRAQERNI